MSRPVRIQLRRTKGWRKPAGAVVVSRPSKFGNPFLLGDLDIDGVTPMTRARVIDRFRIALVDGHLLFTVDDARRELAGKDLACWCPLVDNLGVPVACHADVLLAISNIAHPTKGATP